MLFLASRNLTISFKDEWYAVNVTSMHLKLETFLQAGHVRSARLAGPKITLRFPRLLVYIFVRPHLSHAQ